MAVELLDTERFHGFRVRRQIAGKTYQEYFSLKDDQAQARCNVDGWAAAMMVVDLP